VDPVSRKEFWEMLIKLKEKGITILVSTPYMDEAARCDRIALIQRGQILDIDTFEGILRKNARSTMAIKARNMYKLLLDLRKYPETEKCYSFGEYHHLILDGNPDPELLLDYLTASGNEDIDWKMVDSGIEDVFMDLMEKAK
jgi:ABC-type multidrug transport system ATPase subunit